MHEINKSKLHIYGCSHSTAYKCSHNDFWGERVSQKLNLGIGSSEGISGKGYPHIFSRILEDVYRRNIEKNDVVILNTSYENRYTVPFTGIDMGDEISEIKTDFINNMTHEFKTPIATINLALDAIKNPKIIDDKDKVQRYLQMIRDENKRMHAQVENVLRISKLEKRELEINKENNNLHDIIDEAVEHINLIIEDRQGTITTHFDATRTSVLLNDVHFTNVIVNILDNAIKYSPETPLIDIYTENVKDFIIVKIKDQGAGMSKVAQKRIFEKFYREHTGDLHNVKGHGLGLAYVKKIVENHEGEVYVESEKGKGSTFIIKLPLIN